MDGIRAWGAPEPAALAAFYRRSELEILSRRIYYCAWSGVARLFHLHRSFLSGVRAVARRLVAARGIPAAAHNHRPSASPAPGPFIHWPGKLELWCAAGSPCF